MTIFSDKRLVWVTIQKVAESDQRNLRLLIEHCTAPEARGYTPSDFALSDLKQDDLDKLLGKIKDHGKR